MNYLKRSLMALCSCCLLCGCVNDDEDDFYEISIGANLPEFTVYTSTNEVISSKDFKGSVGVIVFFNTECPDCRKELPIVQRVYEYCIEERKKVRLICISRGQDSISVAKYWRENNLTIPYSAQIDRAVYSLFASSIIPRVYVVSPSLVITNSYTDNPMATYENLLTDIASQNN